MKIPDNMKLNISHYDMKNISRCPRFETVRTPSESRRLGLQNSVAIEGNVDFKISFASSDAQL